MRKLLIVGDSFSSNFSTVSWTTMLPNFLITNLSTAGSSEYRILKKIMEADLKNFSHIIVVHSSPYRIYIDNIPMHLDNAVYKDCDLIYKDVKNVRVKTEFTNNIEWYFENVFDLEQANTMYELMTTAIVNLTKSMTVVHLTFFDNPPNPAISNLHHIWKNFPGSINHLDKNGNKKVAEFINNML